MALFRPFGSLSLRRKLGLATGAALLTAAAMTSLVVLTVWNSAQTIEAARIAHERVLLFGQLRAAARVYQVSSYDAVREPGEESTREFEDASLNFQNLIERTAQLEVSNIREREIRARLTRQARVVLDLFRDASPLVNEVDATWQRSGSRAALREVSRLIAPITRLEEMLEDEIHIGESELGAAVERAHLMNQVAVIVSIVFLAIALAFLVLVQGLLRSRLRPGLARLEDGAVQFGKGNLDHRIRLEGHDELSSLAHAFDAMAGTIAEKQQALRQTQAGLEQAVAERTRELEAANAKLSGVDERRRAFLANAGHELRTPLTIIRGEAEVALRLLKDESSAAQESFECILDQTHVMGRMVEDLFIIARAEAGELPLDRVRLDLAKLATKIATDFDTLASNSGGSISAEVEPNLLMVGDKDRLQRALTALVENALTHCQEGVHIVIRARGDGDRAILSVEDDGPGIDPDITPLMFQRYRRGDTLGEGSGLGLSLVKALVTVHGGAARLEPVEPHGTRAIMELPRLIEGRVAA